MFVAGFAAFVEARGFEFRLDRYGLMQNIYAPGAATPVAREDGQALLDVFFRSGCGEMEPAPGAAAALRALARRASVVVFSNAPPAARLARARWLGRHDLDYPLVLGSGPKGPLAAAMAAVTTGRSAFVDDLIPNLDSMAEADPAVIRFQHVADQRLQPLAPAAPDRHQRIDNWAELAEAASEALTR